MQNLSTDNTLDSVPAPAFSASAIANDTGEQTDSGDMMVDNEAANLVNNAITVAMSAANDESVLSPEPTTSEITADATDEVHPNDRFTVLQITPALAEMNFIMPLPKAMQEIQEGRKLVDADAPIIADFITKFYNTIGSCWKIWIGSVINAMRLPQQENESIITRISDLLKDNGVNIAVKTLYKYAQTARSIMEFAGCLTAEEHLVYEGMCFRMKDVLSSLKTAEDRKKAFAEVTQKQLTTRQAEEYVKSLKPAKPAKAKSTSEKNNGNGGTADKATGDKTPSVTREALTPLVIEDADFLVSAEGQALVDTALESQLAITDLQLIRSSLESRLHQFGKEIRDAQERIDELQEQIKANESRQECYEAYLSKFNDKSAKTATSKTVAAKTTKPAKSATAKPSSNSTKAAQKRRRVNQQRKRQK